jgi:hypothetical protein
VAAKKRGRPNRPHIVDHIAAAIRREPESEYWKMTKAEQQAVEDIPPGKVAARLKQIAEKSRPNDKDREFERLKKHRQRFKARITQRRGRIMFKLF